MTFDPVNDKANFSNIYKDKYTKIVDFIHQGRIPLLNFASKLGSYDTAGRSYGLTLSSYETKAYVDNGYNGLLIIDIGLIGED